MDDGYEDVDTDLIDEMVYQELYEAGIDIDEDIDYGSEDYNYDDDDDDDDEDYSQFSSEFDF